MIKIFFEDKKSFIDKYGQELADLFDANKDRLPKEAADISRWESEFKISPKTARRRLKSYLDEFSSNTETNQFKYKFGSTLFTRFNAIKNLLPSQQKSYRYWLDSTKEELWDTIDEYLPNSYWEKVQEGTRLIKETSDWDIYKITNYEASEYYGRGTGWCTAGNYPGCENDGTRFFKDYAKEYYFYFNKNTGALYNRFRKNPNKPGPDIQIWQGITDDGRTVDKDVSNVKEIKEQLPKIKALDGEEKKAEPTATVQPTRTNNVQRNNANNDVIRLTRFETNWNDLEIMLYKRVNQDIVYIQFPETNGTELVRLYPHDLALTIADVADEYDRFPEEYFTDEEILHINNNLQGGIGFDSEEEIVHMYRDDEGRTISDDINYYEDLYNVLTRMFNQANYYRDNADRILAWLSDVYDGETCACIIYKDDSYELWSFDNSIGTEPVIERFNIVGSYPEQGNDNNNNPVQETEENLPEQTPFDQALAETVINSGIGITSCIGVDDEYQDMPVNEYRLTDERGRNYSVGCFFIEDIENVTRIFWNEHNCAVLVNVADVIFQNTDEIHAFIQGQEGGVVMPGMGAMANLHSCITANRNAYNALHEIIFESDVIYEFDIAEAFARSPLTVALGVEPEDLVFEIQDNYCCLAIIED